MGVCSSVPGGGGGGGGDGTTGGESERKLDKQLNRELEKWNHHDRKDIKVLILGAGESGKSTILKQLNILHTGGFNDDERAKYRQLLRENCRQSIKTLVRACKEFRIPFHQKESLELSQRLDTLDGARIRQLWDDLGIQTAYRRRNEFQLLESAEFLLTHAEELFRDDYTPPDEHILRSRRPTIGVTETTFVIENVPFRVFDVGGQRGERRKWIHCFDDVKAIMYVASLSEFNQVLEEDHTRNRTKESLQLFRGITMLPWFRHTPIMLFLNKDDVFREKIANNASLSLYFPSYTGNNDYESAVDFMVKLYLSHAAEETQNHVYTHITCALDTEKTKFVWNSTRSIVLRENLQGAGLMI